MAEFDDGSVLVPEMLLPLSPGLSDEARGFMQVALGMGSVSIFPEPGESWDEARERMDSTFWRPRMEEAVSRYGVSVVESEIAGIPVDIIRPPEGGASDLRICLIHIHCGAYISGAHCAPEAAVLANKLGIEVISVQYSLPPEHKIVTALSEIVQVYRETLKSYDPAQIGIFGISSGGDMAAMLVGCLVEQGLPLPGGVGICAASGGFVPGDSSYIAPAVTRDTLKVPSPKDFQETVFGDHDLGSPILSPFSHAHVVERFPPTFLSSSTRGPELSGVVLVHRRLVRAGRIAELHVWEGLPHCFHVFVDLPESKDFHASLADFFLNHCARK